MKKLAAIGNIIFIYLTALFPVLLFIGGKNKIAAFIWEHLFMNNIFVPLGMLILFGLIMYAVNISFLMRTWKGKWDAQELAHTNMIVKLIQIPAYIFIFVIGLLCTVMIFTIGISFVFMLLDALSIGMTGLFATAAFNGLKKEQKISGKMQVFCSLASFLFCADVIIAIVGYRRSLPGTKA